MKTSDQIQVWQDALLISQLLAIDPHGFGGVWVKSFASDVRSLWWQSTQGLFPQDSVLTVPASVDDEALLGGIDLAQTLANGVPTQRVGLLDLAHVQVLRMTMAERLRDAAATYISQSFDRDTSQFGMVIFDESSSEEEGIALKLRERCAFQLRFDHLSYFLIKDLPEQASTHLARTRQHYQQIIITNEILDSLVRTSQAFGIDSLRATLFLVKAIKGLTALRGSQVPEVDDIQTAIRLVFTHRITALPSSPKQSEEPVDEPPLDQSPDEPPDPPDNQLAPENEPPDQDAPQDPAEKTPENTPSISQADLEEILINAAKAYLPPDMLAMMLDGAVQTRIGQKNQGKSGDTQVSFTRGSPLPARKGVLKSGQKIDFLKTLQAASPWQRVRSQHRDPAQAVQPMAFRILPEDIHVKRFEQRKTTLTLFVVDASGSAALERLSEAKGAVELLLAKCYVRRDEVALMTFRVNRAELILPPTRSLVRAKRLLTMMPGGGGTPLALAIHSAGQMLSQIQNNGQTPLMIIMTDARANVSLAGIGGREQAFADALKACASYRARAIKTILIDTAIMPQDNAKQIAQALGARYVPLPQGKSGKIIEAAMRV